MLIVFGGLPGVGKTTLARAVAKKLNATYLRIDAIEQALRSSDAFGGGVGAAGYLAAYALAAENLALGRIVVVDSVNPVAITRDAWRNVAASASVAILEVEVICTNANEHRRRIETHRGDTPPLTWQQVVDRHYEHWDGPHLVLDTAGREPTETLVELLSRIDGAR